MIQTLIFFFSPCLRMSYVVFILVCHTKNLASKAFVCFSFFSLSFGRNVPLTSTSCRQGMLFSCVLNLFSFSFYPSTSAKLRSLFSYTQLPSLLHQCTLPRRLSPSRMVRLSPEEFLREDEKALRRKAGEDAHKRISVSAEAAQVRSRMTSGRSWTEPEIPKFRHYRVSSVFFVTLLHLLWSTNVFLNESVCSFASCINHYAQRLAYYAVNVSFPCLSQLKFVNFW